MKAERNQKSNIIVFYSFLLRIVQYPAGVKTDHTAMRRPPSWFHHAQPIGKREQFPHSQSGTRKCHSNLTRAWNLSTSQNRRISFYLSIAGGILVWTRHLKKEINGKFFYFRWRKKRDQDGTDSHDKNNAIASKQVNITFNNNK